MHGGEIVAAGTPEEVMSCEASLTGAYLAGRMKIVVPAERRSGNGLSLTVRGAHVNNLKNITVNFPLGKFICVTGVSGSGKSSLVNGILYSSVRRMLAGGSPVGCDSVEGLENIDKVIAIDQSPIGRTPRSNPATYTGVFTDIRAVFAAVPEAKQRRLQGRAVLVQCERRTL